MKRDVTALLTDALEALGVSPCPHIEIEVPREDSFGDLSSPVAMTMAKALKKAPRKIAEDIVGRLKDNPIFEKIEIAGPGFINFTFTKSYLLSSLQHLLKAEKAFLRENVGEGKKVLVEFVSANPTGPLHIGHARGAAVGNALCNLLAESGFTVDREYYINDAGRQVRLLGLSVYARYQQLTGNEVPFPEDGYRGQYIDDEASALRAERGETYKGISFDICGTEITSWTYSRMLVLIRKDLSRFGVTEFDAWISEKEIFAQGEVANAIETLQQKGFIYQHANALWFRSTAFRDDKDRVVIKSDGEYTYFASDIAYHKNKLDRGYDTIIDIWGADHHGYIPRIESVMQAFGYDISQFRVILVQMVNLMKHGEPFQMSKRAGTFVTLSDIIDLVGADTTKFIFLTRKADSHLDFDLDVVTATSAENPVFYVQYANARINSILTNAREKGLEPAQGVDLALLAESAELVLIKKLLTYPMVLENAARSFEPHRITFYLQELAAMFHTYYHNHRVIGEDAALTHARLSLCSAIRIVLSDALGILGVSAPEKM
ncbi:MAG: arginine--tRNA ligase [Nitrospirae bacterium]|nr:arginine--tRNA ligase [Nitrospirota bacterium]